MAAVDTDALARARNASESTGPLSATPERAVLLVGLGALVAIFAFRAVFRDLVL